MTLEYTFSAVPEATALEDGFPAGTLSRIAEHESWRKEVHRPATSTHKWWAKRLGTVFRGILISAVTQAHKDALLPYGSAARLDGLTVFDPFAGSGITLVEAIKLGANVVGWDINPVATLVQRQAVQRWDLSELQRILPSRDRLPRRDRPHAQVRERRDGAVLLLGGACDVPRLRSQHAAVLHAGLRAARVPPAKPRRADRLPAMP